MVRCELRYGLLGPPLVYDDEGRARPIGSPKLRTLLAALLLEAGRVVSVSALQDALWGPTPPASARASLHNHVTRLRRLLDDPERLRAVPPGYLLRVEDGELDVHLFERGIAQARAAHAERDWARVVRACTQALALWRGAPLDGLPADLGGYAFVQRLQEARLLLLEWRYDAELALGGDRLAGLVPELAALAAEHPLREVYHRQLMLALHRAGRQAEALAVHRDLRARLIEELGVEPGPAVREAHAEVLRGTAGESGDPFTAGAAAGGGRAGTAAGRRTGTAREPVAAGTAREHTATGTAREQGAAVGGVPGARAGAVAKARGTGGRRAGKTAGAFGPGTPAASGLSSPVAEAAHGAEDEPAYGAEDESAYGAEDEPAYGDGGPAGSADPVDPVDPAGSAGTAGSASPAEPTGPAELAGSVGLTRLTTPPRPAQLPPAPAHFTGRTDVVRALLDALAAGRPAGPEGAAAPGCPVAVVSGMAGVGKSALALHVAHELRNRFPDGQLYVNLHGATPGVAPLTAGQALRTLLRDLGTEPRLIPEHPDEAAALLRSLLTPTRTLMVLDDAANAAQVRPLLPAGSGCAVIVTSRSPLTALDGASRFPLAPLTGEESAALLRAVSGRDGLHAGHPLVHLTGRLPLALRVVAARLAARRALTPDVLADQLAATERRLHHLEYDDLSVRRSLAVAHDALAGSEREADRDAAQALRRIGALDLPVYGAPLLARLTDGDERRAEAALDRLVDVALLEETAYGRYTPHDLVRDFARELAGDGRETGRTVVTALRWYAAVAERVMTVIVEPGLDQDDRRRPTAAQPPGHAAEVAAVAPFARSEDAFAWGDRELENVVALVERYADAPDEHVVAHVSTLVRLFFPYAQRRGRLAEMAVLGRAALTAARRLQDEAAEAYALSDLAGLHFLTGRHGEALALTDRALAIWRRLGVLSWIRRCLNNRGLLLEGLGRYAESGAALRQSLVYSRQLNDPHGEAVTYSHLGNLYEHTDPRAAIEQHRRSLAIGEAIGAVIVQHSAHCNIGYAHLTLGEPAAAAAHFEESLRILGGHGDWHGESQTRLGLVRALRQLGRLERAGRECAELLARADARADRYVGGLARHQHGLLLREQGRCREAYAQWRAALEALDGTDEKAVAAELRALLGEADMRRCG
nr:AfsR/SARP family transcriptional regulator [Streptomyces echinoruber]